jgi:hypothetical protein
MSTLLLLTDPANPSCVVPARGRIRTRFWTRLHSRALDQALAAGVSPDTSIALSLRAHALISPRSRKRLARSVRRLIRDAQHPVGPLDPSVPICRRKILRSSKTLEQLAVRLDSVDPVDARGAAKSHLLVNQSRGPVCDGPMHDDLEPAIRHVLRALELTV